MLLGPVYRLTSCEARGNLKFSLNFERYLDDPEATFTNSKGDLTLHDLYVSPMLQKQDYDSKAKEIFRSYDLLEKLQDAPHMIISGPDYSGKTTLSKILCGECLRSGLVPVLLKGGDINDPQEARLLNQIYRNFERQYSADVIEEFKQLPPSKRVVIVDNYAKTRLNIKGRRRLLEILSREFTYVVLLADDFAIRLNEIVNHNGDSLMRSFSRYRILEFGYKLRDEIALRWLRPDDDYTTDAAALGLRVKHVRDVLDTVLGRNFIPSYPFFILTILQLLETNTQLDTSAASYSYGYFYQALIYQQLDSVSYSLDPSTSSTYLGELAYYLFSSRTREITITEMKKIHERYCEEYKRPLNFDDTLNALNKGLIILANEHTIRFRYGYYYYFFVATYFRDRINDEQTKADITALSEKVYKEEFANILLFLTHLSKDPYIIGELLTKSKNLYNDITPTDLDKDVDFLNDIHKAIPQLVYEDRDPEEVRQEIAEKLDKDSDLSGEEIVEPDLDEQEEKDLKDILEINKAYKTIQILGQILKNSPGSIKGDTKLEVAGECYALGRRLLSKIFHLIRDNLDEVVQDIVARIEEKHPEADRDELVDGVRKFLFMMTGAIGFGMIKWVTYSVGSEKLEETFKDIHAQDTSVATALIDVSIKFDHIGTYPIEEVKTLKQRLEKNIYSLGLLQVLALSHMDLYYVTREMKQRMCQLLDVEFKALPSPKALERPNAD